VGGAKRLGPIVTLSMKTCLDIATGRSHRQAWGHGLLLVAQVLQPVVDAGGRIAERGGVMAVGAAGDARTPLGDEVDALLPRRGVGDVAEGRGGGI
jgi:hypothetical protein